MLRLLRQSFHNPSVLVVPIVVAVTAISVVIGTLLYWSAVQVDTATASREQDILARAIARSVQLIGKEQEASTVWDDAVERVLAPDPEWFDANLGIWFHSYYGHDEAFVLDGHDEPIYAMIAGERTSPANYRSARPALPPLVRQLRQQLAKGALADGPDTLTTGVQDIAVVGSHPAIVSVKPIVSDTGTIDQTPGSEGVHVSVRYLDGDYTSRLASNFLLKDARFSWQDDRRGNEVAFPYRSNSGVVVGYLIWTPYLPGTEIRQSVEPALAMALAWIAVIIGVLVFALRKGASALAESEKLARHLAEHDSLTDLPNRMLFNERLTGSLQRARAEDTQLALLALDLDRFKQVNDTLGHPAGDELLRQVGARLCNAVRGSDTVARVGGDEFYVILPNTNDWLIDKVSVRLLAGVREPFDIMGHPVSIGLSIGVAVAPLDAVDEEQLVRHSDLALYAAKRQGRNRYVRYSASLETLPTRDTANTGFDLQVVPVGA